MKRVSLTVIVIISVLLKQNISASVVNADHNNQIALTENNFLINSSFADDNRTRFDFMINNHHTDIVLLGNWEIKLGYGLGFTLFPEISWLNTIPDFNDGIIFEQKRAFALNWMSDSGISFDLFVNDQLEQTEFTFRYQYDNVFKSLFITNKFEDRQINPYRKLTGGKVTDINFGLEWETPYYYGRFDFQFDSVQQMSDQFRGGKKEINGRIFSSDYMRGYYYYLPDNNIVNPVTVMVSDTTGNYLSDNIAGLRFSILEPEKDYRIDYQNGKIAFNRSYYGRTVIIRYFKNSNGLTAVGDPSIGKAGVYNLYDFNFEDYPDYRMSVANEDYLIIAFSGKNSVFEEKSAYLISSPGSEVSGLDSYITGRNGQRQNGFNIYFDGFTGGLIVSAGEIKGSYDNIYPFYNSVDLDKFYLSNNNPTRTDSSHYIDYSFLSGSEGLNLSQKPVVSSIKVYLNEVELKNTDFTYDHISNSVYLNMDISESDTVRIVYVAEKTDDFNLTTSMRNEFALGRYLRLIDSYWLRFPAKLWEDSYYDRLKSLEFIYGIELKAQYGKLITKRNGVTLDFNFGIGFSILYPELRGIASVEDFERSLSGFKLNLNYRQWFPVMIPASGFTDLSGVTGYGRLYYRNLHQADNLQSDIFDTIDGGSPKDPYQNGKTIGPYSSFDGYYGESNSLSLVSEFELDAGEAVSFVYNCYDDSREINFGDYSSLIAAVRAMSVQGEVKIFIDGGKVGESFDSTNMSVQNEQSDEGIRYLIDNDGEYIYLYKGRNDGVNSTNDLDRDGYLSTDSGVAGDITIFTERTTGNQSVSITGNQKKVINYNIENPLALISARGIRITLYSELGANGILIFNQLRLSDTGFTHNTDQKGVCEEIFPAEDPILLDRVFSKENAEFDSRIKINRTRERTLRVTMYDGEPFVFQKRFSIPVDIRQFNKFGFFIMPDSNSSRNLTIRFIDSEYNSYSIQYSVSELDTLEWNQIEIDTASIISGGVNGLIDCIEFEFDSSGSNDALIVYIDEFYLDQPVPFAGGYHSTTFLYEDPELSVIKNGFEIYAHPYFKIENSLTSMNFLVDSFYAQNDFRWKSEALFLFRLITLNWQIRSKLVFIFDPSGNFRNQEEALRVRIERNKKDIPFGFIFDYDFTKLQRYYSSSKILYSQTINRSLYNKLWFDYNGIININGLLDSKTNISESKNTELLLNWGIILNLDIIKLRTSHSIIINAENNNLSGLIGFENFGRVFSDDISLIAGDLRRSRQFVEWGIDFKFTENIVFSDKIRVENILHVVNPDHALLTGIFRNESSINFFYKEDGYDFRIAGLSYSRNGIFYKNINSNTASLERFYTVLSRDNNILFDVAMFPPFFSLINLASGTTVFGRSVDINSLNDKVSLNLDWASFVDEGIFAPSSFNISYSENVTTIGGFVRSGKLSTVISASAHYYPTGFDMISISLSLGNTEEFYSNRTVFSNEINTGAVFEINENTSFEFVIKYKHEFSLFTSLIEGAHNIEVKTNFFKSFYFYNIDGVLSGPDMDFSVLIKSSVYTTGSKLSDRTNTPFSMVFDPVIGYKFNKFFRLTGDSRMGLHIDYSPVTEVFIYRWGLEISVSGVFTF